MAEKTAEQYEKEIAQLKKERDEAVTAKTAAEKSLAEANSINTQLKADVAGKDKELDEAKTVVGLLKEELASKEFVKPKYPVITHQKEAYELLSPFTWAGKPVTAERLEKEPKLVAELIKEGVQSLRLIEK